MVLQPIAPSEGASRYRVFALFGALTTATLGRSSRRAKSDPQSCPIQPPHGVPGCARLAGHINPSRVRLVSSDTPTAFASLSTYRDTWLPLLRTFPQTLVLQSTLRYQSSWQPYSNTPASRSTRPTRRASISTPTTLTALGSAHLEMSMTCPTQTQANLMPNAPRLYDTLLFLRPVIR